MSSPGIVIDEGSVLGSHRGGLGGIDFSSLILFDIERSVQFSLSQLRPETNLEAPANSGDPSLRSLLSLCVARILLLMP